jgi:sentrin-specific protease 1
VSIRQIEPQERVIISALFHQPPSDHRVSAPPLPCVTLRSFHSLLPGRWLGDEVINGYLSLLSQRETFCLLAQSTQRPSTSYSTHFYAKLANLEDRNISCRGYSYQQVLNWGRRQSPLADIFRLETLFVPINTDNAHWTAATIHFPTRTITYLDSLGDPGHIHLRRLLRYLKDEHQHLYQRELPEWTLVPTPPTTPRQVNGFDCGVYVCYFANRVFQRFPMSASPADITNFREHIGVSVVTNSIILYGG